MGFAVFMANEDFARFVERVGQVEEKGQTEERERVGEKEGERDEGEKGGE